eukprot:g4102.t1
MSASEENQDVNMVSTKVKDTLKYGDVIFLYTEEDTTGLLHAEGLCENELGVSQLEPGDAAPLDFRECLFRVVPQQLYTASDEYRSELDRIAKTGEVIGLSHLEEACDKELKMNKNEEKRLFGSVVLYGDTIQLQHVVSKKWVTFCTSVVAKIESSCFKVETQRLGSMQCQLVVNPRYRVRSQGDQIDISDFVVFASATAPDDHLHANRHKEVNVSFVKTSWKILRYTAAKTALENRTEKSSNRVPLSCMVQFFHPQSSSYLACKYLDVDGLSPNATGEEKQPQYNQSKHVKFEQPMPKRNPEIGVLLMGKPSKSLKNAGGEAEDDAAGFEVKYPATSYLWIIECQKAHIGGMSEWKMIYRFRSALTGLYLCRGPPPPSIHEVLEDGGEDDPHIAMSVTDIRETDATAFVVQPSHKSLAGNTLHFGDGLYLQFSPSENAKEEIGETVWLNQGDDFPFDEKCGTADVGTVINFSGFEEDDALILQQVTDDAISDVQMAISISQRIRDFSSLIQRHLNENEKISRVEFDELASLLLRGVLFSKDPNKSDGAMCASIEAKIDSGELCDFGSCIAALHGLDATFFAYRRQLLLKETRVMEYCFELLWALTQMAVLNEPTKDVYIERIRKLCMSVYRLIHFCFEDNRLNQEYCSQFMENMIAHINLNIGSDKCLTELVENNMALLQGKVERQHIDLFLDLIHKYGLRPQYMRFLLVLCRCNGVAVDSNQDLLAEQLLSDNANLIFQTRPMPGGLNAVKFDITTNDVALYKQDKGGAVLLEEMVNNPPAVLISWSSEFSGTTPEKLFGKEWIPITEFTQNGSNAVRTSKRNALERDPIAEIYEYYIYQLRLLAALCLDRNYLGIEQLEPLLTIETVVSCTFDDRLTLRTRKAFGELLQALYIDRAPQNKVAFPRYARLYERNEAKIFGNDIIDATKVESLPSNSEPNKFALIQCLIQRYYENLDKMSKSKDESIKERAELTKCITDIMSKLVKYGCYGRVPQLRMLTKFLITSLDDRSESDDKKAQDNEEDENEEKKQKGKRLSANEIEELLLADDEVEPTMKERTETFLDGKGYMIYIIGLTIISVLVGVVGLVDTTFADQSGVKTFDMTCLILFSLDVVLRAWAMGTDNYFIDWLCLVDLLVVLVDVAGIVVFAGEVSKESTTLVKTFRMLRLLRLLRLIRAAKMAILLATMKDRQVTVMVCKKVSGSRYKMTADTEARCECKLAQVKLLRVVMSIICDYRMSRILEKFFGKCAELAEKDRMLVDTYGFPNLSDYLVEEYTESVEENEEKNDDENDEDVEDVEFDFAKETAAKSKKKTQIVPFHPVRDFEGSLAREEFQLMDFTNMCEGLDVDGILLDLAMFDMPKLSGEAVRLLCLIYQQRKNLLEAFAKAFVLSTPTHVAMFREMNQTMHLLLASIEAYEVWGDLPDQKEVQRRLEEARRLLGYLTSCCRGDVNKKTLQNETKKNEESDSEVQISLLHMGVIELIDEFLKVDVPDPEDPPDDPEEQNTMMDTIDTLQCLNLFLESWVCNNPITQKEMIPYISDLEDHIENVPGTTNMICAVFAGNPELCRDVPRSLLAYYIEKISETDDPKPEYLSLMNTVTNPAGVAIRENQLHVLDLLTDPAKREKCLRLFQDYESDDYKNRNELLRKSNFMASNLLQYHVRLLALMANCCAGDYNLAEAICQTAFKYESLLYAINDESTLWSVKQPLMHLFYHMCVEAETKLVGLINTEGMSSLFSLFSNLLKEYCRIGPVAIQQHICEVDLISTEQTFLDSDVYGPEGVRDIKESDDHLLLLIYHQILPTIACAFERYRNDYHGENIRLVLEISTMVALIRRISATVERPSALVLHQKASRCWMSLVKLPALRSINVELQATKAINMMKGDIPRERTDPHPLVPHCEDASNRFRETEIDVESKENDAMNEAKQTDSLEEKEGKYVKLAFTRMKTILANSSRLKRAIRKESHSVVEKINSLRNAAQDVNVGSVVLKMITHVKDSTLPGERQYTMKIGSDAEIEALGILELLEIYSNSGGRDPSPERDVLQDQIVAGGGINLVLGLIADGMPAKLMSSALQLGISLLSDHEEGPGGYEKAQKIAFTWLNSGDSEPFFNGVNYFIQSAVDELSQLEVDDKFKDEFDSSPSSLQQEGESKGETSSEVEEPDWNAEVILGLLEFLQLLCEGHFSTNQELMIAQPNNRSSRNLLEVSVSFLEKNARRLDDENLEVSGKILDFLVEAVQGPCSNAQVYLACSTNLLDVCNRVMYKVLGLAETGDVTIEWAGLMENVMILMLGLLEGRTDNRVHNMMLGVLNFATPLKHLAHVRDRIVNDLGGVKNAASGKSEVGLSFLSQGCMISALLSTLQDYNSHWFEEHVASSPYYGSVVWILRQMSSIEVVWLGRIHKVHFPKNDLARHLNKENLSFYLALLINFLLLIAYRYDRDYQSPLSELAGTARESGVDEDGILSFLDNKDFFQHQSDHTHFDHRDVFNHTNVYEGRDDPTLERTDENVDEVIPTTTFTHSHFADDSNEMKNLYNTEYVNMRLTLKHTFMKNYGISDDGIVQIITILGTLQTITSGFILLVFLAVKVPPAWIEYDNLVLVLIRTPTAYYFGYFLFALLGTTSSFPLLSLHLLDVVIRDSLTGAVVNAVIYPRRQLMWTVVLGGFVLYIFAVIIFLFYPADWEDSCVTLLRCSIAAWNFGTRDGEIAQEGDYELENDEWVTRTFLLDYTFFWVVGIILLNVIFGIIVDTFGDLRGQKEEQHEDMSNNCFICNINRNDFESANQNFTTHIKEQHNMWEYLNFLLHLRTKDGDEYNGLEDYVAACLEAEEITWFPVNCALVLDGDEEENFEEETKKMMLEKMTQIEKEMKSLIADVRSVETELTMKRTDVEMFKEEMKEVSDILAEVSK